MPWQGFKLEATYGSRLTHLMNLLVKRLAVGCAGLEVHGVLSNRSALQDPAHLAVVVPTMTLHRNETNVPRCTGRCTRQRCPDALCGAAALGQGALGGAGPCGGAEDPAAVSWAVGAAAAWLGVEAVSGSFRFPYLPIACRRSDGAYCGMPL